MSDSVIHPTRQNDRAVTSESQNVRRTLIGIAIVFAAVVLFLPLIVVFVEAFRKGVAIFLNAFVEPDALAAIRLSLLVAAIAVPFNAGFGVAAAWAIAKFNFRGKNLLLSLIDLPFSVSPVISGLVFVLLFGAQGWLGPWLRAHNVEIIFAVPGIVLATVFVTFPFVAREIIPLMQAQGITEEEAALMLGLPAGTLFSMSPCPILNGPCFTVCCCATRAPWVSLAQFRSSLAIFAASPTRCLYTLRCFIMTIILWLLLPWPRCWHASVLSPSFSDQSSSGTMRILLQQRIAISF